MAELPEWLGKIWQNTATYSNFWYLWLSNHSIDAEMASCPLEYANISLEGSSFETIWDISKYGHDPIGPSAVLLGQYPNLDRFWRTSNFVGIILPELIRAQKHRKWHKRILPNFAIWPIAISAGDWYNWAQNNSAPDTKVHCPIVLLALPFP